MAVMVQVKGSALTWPEKQQVMAGLETVQVFVIQLKVHVGFFKSVCCVLNITKSHWTLL